MHPWRRDNAPFDDLVMIGEYSLCTTPSPNHWIPRRCFFILLGNPHNCIIFRWSISWLIEEDILPTCKGLLNEKVSYNNHFWCLSLSKVSLSLVISWTLVQVEATTTHIRLVHPLNGVPPSPTSSISYLFHLLFPFLAYVTLCVVLVFFFTFLSFVTLNLSSLLSLESLWSEHSHLYCWHEKPRWFASWRFDENWMKLFWTILKP